MSSGNEALLKLAELFKILGDPTRLKIVELLLENEMCVNHIAETMGMGQSAISHQLRVLRQARLVTYKRKQRPESRWVCSDYTHNKGKWQRAGLLCKQIFRKKGVMR